MMRVSELEGALLDYWVLRAEGWEDDRPQDMQMTRDGEHCIAGLPPKHAVSGHLWRSPSTNWAQGGPILARMIESGEFCAWEHKGVVTVSNWDAECLPCKEPAREDVPHVYGQASTLLVAGMRCYVVSKFGEEVPDSADDVLLS